MHFHFGVAGCGRFTFDCYAVALPEDEYEFYADTYCNTLRPPTCLLESTIFLCELREIPYDFPDNFDANNPIGIDIFGAVGVARDTNVSGSTTTPSTKSTSAFDGDSSGEWALLLAVNYSAQWNAPFSNLRYWEVARWTQPKLRKTGDDMLVLVNVTTNSTVNVTTVAPMLENDTFASSSNSNASAKHVVHTSQQLETLTILEEMLVPSVAGPWRDCVAFPSTAIDLTWCLTNKDAFMTGLDRGIGEYLSDIDDA